MSTGLARLRLDDMTGENIVEELTGEQGHCTKGYERNNPVAGASYFGEDDILGKGYVSEIAEKVYKQVEDDRLTPNEAGKVFADILNYRFGSDYDILHKDDVNDIIEHAVWRDNSGDIPTRENEGFFDSRREDKLSSGSNTSPKAEEYLNVVRGTYEMEDSVWDDTVYIPENVSDISSVWNDQHGNLMGYDSEEDRPVKLTDVEGNSVGDIGEMAERLIAETRLLMHNKAPFNYSTNNVGNPNQTDWEHIDHESMSFGTIGMMFAELTRDLDEEGYVKQSDMDSIWDEASNVDAKK